jgi:hypothetical protein
LLRALGKVKEDELEAQVHLSPLKPDLSSTAMLHGKETVMAHSVLKLFPHDGSIAADRHISAILQCSSPALPV